MAWSKRASKDIQDLLSNGFVLVDDSLKETTPENLKSIVVRMKPLSTDCPQHQAPIHVRFTLSETFPFQSPSVGFYEKIWHPNVDLASGSICLDSLNSKWSPSFTLRHVVEVLLPYLLTQPNPDDPLNRDAAAQFKQNPAAQALRIKDYLK